MTVTKQTARQEAGRRAAVAGETARERTAVAGKIVGTAFVGEKVISLAMAFALPLAAGAMLGISSVYLAMRPQWYDQTWLLFVAGRILDGARLGVDVMEVNPPLIAWLSTIPVMIGRALDIQVTDALQGCLILLVAFSVVWSNRLLRRGAIGDAQFAGWFALLLLFATVVHPWLEFGQREHMLVLLVLPYLVMAAGRIDGVTPRMSEALAIGLCAGIGFLLKPNYLLVVLAVEALVLFRRREIRLLYRPELVAMVATALGYAAAIWLWAPEWLLNVLPLAFNTYYDFDRVGVLDLIPPMRAVKLVMLVLVLAILYRRLVHRALATVLLLAGLAATAAFAVEMKGYLYHMVPMRAFFDLLVGTMAIDLWLKWAARWARPVSTTLAITGAALMFVAAIAVCLPLQLARVSHPHTDERMAVLRAISRYIPSSSTMLLVSTWPEGVLRAGSGPGLEMGIQVRLPVYGAGRRQRRAFRRARRICRAQVGRLGDRDAKCDGRRPYSVAPQPSAGRSLRGCDLPALWGHGDHPARSAELARAGFRFRSRLDGLRPPRPDRAL